MQNHFGWSKVTHSWKKKAVKRRKKKSENFLKLFLKLFIHLKNLQFDQHQKLKSCIEEHKLPDIFCFSLNHCRMLVRACCQVLGMADTTMNRRWSEHIDRCKEKEEHKLRTDCNLSLELERLELSNCYGTTSLEVLSVEKITEDVDQSKSKLRIKKKLIFAFFKGDCDDKKLL